LLFQDQINSLFEEPTHVAIKENQNENNIPKTSQKNETVLSTPSPKESTKDKTIEFSLKPDSSVQNTKTSLAANVEQIKPQEAPNLKTGKRAEKKPVIQLSAVNPNPVPASKQRQIISITGTGFHKRQQVKVSWTGKEKLLAQNQVNITSDTYMNLILNVGTQNDNWTVTVNDPLLNIKSNSISFNVVAENRKPVKIVAAKTEEKIQAKKHNGIYDQNWIKQQNKNDFTLQLLGTHQKNTLQSYLKKFNLKNDAAVFKTQRDGKDWFTLIYGAYPSKSAAQAATKQLPKGITKPWIRSFASILPSLNTITPSKSATALKQTTTSKIPATAIAADQEGWLWSQDPRHYTLQLAAGTDKKAIQNFIKRHQLSGKAVYFHRLRDGKDWYILVYGSYSGYSKAKQAIGQLPLAVQKSKPWARSFSAIHAELN